MYDHMWHQRLGYRYHDAIRRLVHDDLAVGNGIHITEKIVSDCYVKGKMSRNSFPNSSEKRAG